MRAAPSERGLLSAHAVHAGALQAGVYARPGQGRGSTRGAPAILNVLSSERGEDVGIDAPKRYSCRKCMMKRSPQMMGTLWCGAPPECASRAGGCGFDTRWCLKNGYTVLTCRLRSFRKRCCDPERGPSVSAQPTRLPLGDTAPRGSVITARRLDTASAVHSMVE